MRQVHATLAGGGQQLLDKERVALRAGDDRLRHRGREGRSAAALQQGLHLLAAKRPQLQPRRHAGAPEPHHESAEPMLAQQLLAAVGPKQQHPPLVEVVGEEGDQVEGRAVRPVQVLQHQDDGFGGRDRVQQREQLLEQPELRSRRAVALGCGVLAQNHPGRKPSQLTGRPQQLSDVLAGQQRTNRLGDRQVWHIGADQVDAPPHQRLRSRCPRPGAEFGHQPGLADARVAGHQDRPAPSRRRLPHLLLETLELREAADQGGVRPRCHRTSMAAPWHARKAAGKALGRRDRARRSAR